MTAAIYDFAAIAKLTKAFAEEPPQNEVKERAAEADYGNLVWSDYEQRYVPRSEADYGMFAG